MQELITTRGEEKLNKWVSENASRYYYTDSDGIASMTELELGLYLVAETDITKHDGIFGDMHFGMNYNSETGQWTGQLSTGGGSINHTPAIGQETKKAYAVGEYYREMGSADKEAPVIESLSAPFLVSVPMTNAADTDKSSGTKWQYTVDVFPKNQTTSVHKRIIDPDEASGQETLRLTEDFQEGDMIEEVIWSDVPALLPNYYSEDIEHPDSMNRDRKSTRLNSSH